MKAILKDFLCFAPFGEVAGGDLGLQDAQVIQVDVLWSLVLAPPGHTFLLQKQDKFAVVCGVFLIFFLSK